MDNVLDLNDYRELKGVDEKRFGEFVTDLQNKYGNRKPAFMYNTIDNFNNKGIQASAGGPRENDIWYIYLPEEDTLYIKPGRLSMKAQNPTRERT